MFGVNHPPHTKSLFGGTPPPKKKKQKSNILTIFLKENFKILTRKDKSEVVRDKKVSFEQKVETNDYLTHSWYILNGRLSGVYRRLSGAQNTQIFHKIDFSKYECGSFFL